MLVNALDHEEWQTEKHVEQWMLIGRNANLTLTLYNDENEEEMERFGFTPIDYLIIPLIDYYEQGDPRVLKQLIRLIEPFYEDKRHHDALFIFTTNGGESRWKRNVSNIRTDERADERTCKYR
ncbi:hypothetical protein ACI2OX_14920 [Bacillus sp. N9]